MTKRLLTPKEQEQLKKNPYVKSVSENAITYTDMNQLKTALTYDTVHRD